MNSLSKIFIPLVGLAAPALALQAIDINISSGNSYARDVIMTFPALMVTPEQVGKPCEIEGVRVDGGLKVVATWKSTTRLELHCEGEMDPFTVYRLELPATWTCLDEAGTIIKSPRNFCVLGRLSGIRCDSIYSRESGFTKPVYLYVNPDSASDEQVAPFMAKARLEMWSKGKSARDGGQMLRCVDAPARPLRVGDVLADWEYFRHELMLGHLKDADEESLKKLDPQERIPSYWVINPVMPQQGEQRIRVCIPDLGGRSEEGLIFREWSEYVSYIKDADYELTNEYLGEGLYRVQIHFGQPIKGDDPQALADQLSWKHRPYVYEQDSDWKDWEPRMQEQDSMSITLDKEETQKFARQLTMPDGTAQSCYSKLVFTVDTKGIPQVVDCSARMETILGIPINEKLVTTHDSRTRLRPPTPRIRTALTMSGVQAAGKRSINVDYRGVSQIKAKILPLDTSPESAVRVMKVYEKFYKDQCRGYTQREYGERQASMVPEQLLPLIEGRQEMRLDAKEGKAELTLAGEGQYGLYFVELQGQPTEEWLKANPEAETKQIFNQNIIQLTDLGMIWKQSSNQLYIYGYQLSTGKAVAEGVVRLLDAQGKVLKEVPITAEGGVVEIPAKEIAYLQLCSGQDCFIAEAKLHWDTLNYRDSDLWQYVDIAKLPKTICATFTDRKLYRPGETVHVKGMLRDLCGNDLSTPQDLSEMELVVTQARNKEVGRFKPQIEADGSFAQDIPIPDDAYTGDYRVSLKLTRKGDADKSSADMRLLATVPEDAHQSYAIKSYLKENREFSFSFSTAEFRRNEFELSSSMSAGAEPDEYFMAVDAMNLNGTPLADGKANWSLRCTDTNFYPKGYSDYRFGDHREWDFNLFLCYLCGQGPRESTGQSYSSTHESSLDAQGHGSATLLRKGGSFPMRQMLDYSCTVLNGNGQRLATSQSDSYDPAEIYVGLHRMSKYSQAGKDKSLPLDLVLVDTDGKPYTSEQTLGVKVTREAKIDYRLGMFDRSSTRSKTTELPVLEQELQVVNGKAQLSIPLEEAGRYTISVGGKDAKGQEFRSAICHQAWVDEKPTQLGDDDSWMDLWSDKDMYRAGDVAKLLVENAMDGELLVSIEREKVLRQFRMTLSADNPLIEIPLMEGDAPGVKVSVTFFGEKETTGRYKGLPRLRNISETLFVDPVEARLSVDLQTPEKLLAVGESCTISGQVKDAKGNPVPSARLCLFAEDEGTLQAGGYSMPDFLQNFYGQRDYAVLSYSNRKHILGEDSKVKDYGNKGIFIGGGGVPAACFMSADNAIGGLRSGALIEQALRSNFNPCAFWQPHVICDEEGRFSITVENPDLLTRYRVMAIASAGETQFGSATGSYEVSKGIMLEPSAPLGATLGDVVKVPVTLSMNNKMLPADMKDARVTWKVELQTNEQVSTSTPAQTIDLQGLESKTLIFPVQMDKTGKAEFTWLVSPAAEELAEQGLADAVKDDFTINPPTPYLREAFFSVVPAGQSFQFRTSLKTPFNEDAKADLCLSPSPLAAAMTSIETLQAYPYECSEQLSSRLWPLLMAQTLHDGMGLSVKDKEARDAEVFSLISSIRKREYRSGLISYWPEQSAPSSFNASIWLALVAAQNQGYIAKNDWEMKRALEAMQKALLADATPLSSGNDASNALANPLGLLVLAEAGMLTDDLLSRILNKRASDEAWHGAQAKHIVTLAAYRIQSPKAEFYKTAAAILKSGKDLYSLPSARVLKLMIRTEEDAANPDLAADLNEEIRRHAHSVHHTTFETAWMVQLLADYISKTGVDKASCLIDNQELRAAAPLILREINIATTPAKKVEQATAYGFGIAEGYTTEKQEPAVVDKGFRINRMYEKLMPDGTWQASELFKVGDIVRIKLNVRNTTGETGQYIAIEDIMPAGLELLNPAVKGQMLPAVLDSNRGACWSWGSYLSYKQYMKDRIRLFSNSCPSNQEIEVQYIARVVKSGTMTAPSAKAEMMYKPQIYGLSVPSKMTIDAE